MSAAALQATLPHYQEALGYWDDFTVQCQRHVQAINTVVTEKGLPLAAGVQWRPGSLNASLVRSAIPSTEITLNLAFENWGPTISGSVRGLQAGDLHFYPEEFEFTVGTDQDDSVVAITNEGRSLSPHEFAKYVVQHFRRSYPGITLPCPENPLE
jgi:hypothetical protein